MQGAAAFNNAHRGLNKRLATRGAKRMCSLHSSLSYRTGTALMATSRFASRLQLYPSSRCMDASYHRTSSIRLSACGTLNTLSQTTATGCIFSVPLSFLLRHGYLPASTSSYPPRLAPPALSGIKLFSSPGSLCVPSHVCGCWHLCPSSAGTCAATAAAFTALRAHPSIPAHACHGDIPCSDILPALCWPHR